MDQQQLRADLAEALGKATAMICIQTALVATLKAKGILADSDVASLSGLANDALTALPDVPDDARVVAHAALRGLAKAWTRRVTRN
jgi:hypothetical protein